MTLLKKRTYDYIVIMVLVFLKNISRPEKERKMKPIAKVLEDYELSKVVHTNLKTVNFLDVIFDFEKIFTNLIKH